MYKQMFSLSNIVLKKKNLKEQIIQGCCTWVCSGLQLEKLEITYPWQHRNTKKTCREGLNRSVEDKQALSVAQMCYTES